MVKDFDRVRVGIRDDGTLYLETDNTKEAINCIAIHNSSFYEQDDFHMTSMNAINSADAKGSNSTRLNTSLWYIIDTNEMAVNMSHILTEQLLQNVPLANTIFSDYGEINPSLDSINITTYPTVRAYNNNIHLKKLKFTRATSPSTVKYEMHCTINNIIFNAVYTNNKTSNVQPNISYSSMDQSLIENFDLQLYIPINISYKNNKKSDFEYTSLSILVFVYSNTTKQYQLFADMSKINSSNSSPYTTEQGCLLTTYYGGIIQQFARQIGNLRLVDKNNVYHYINTDTGLSTVYSTSIFEIDNKLYRATSSKVGSLPLIKGLYKKYPLKIPTDNEILKFGEANTIIFPTLVNINTQDITVKTDDGKLVTFDTIDISGKSNIKTGFYNSANNIGKAEILVTAVTPALTDEGVDSNNIPQGDIITKILTITDLPIVVYVGYNGNNSTTPALQQFRYYFPIDRDFLNSFNGYDILTPYMVINNNGTYTTKSAYIYDNATKIKMINSRGGVSNELFIPSASTISSDVYNKLTSDLSYNSFKYVDLDFSNATEETLDNTYLSKLYYEVWSIFPQVILINPNRT